MASTRTVVCEEKVRKVLSMQRGYEERWIGRAQVGRIKSLGERWKKPGYQEGLDFDKIRKWRETTGHRVWGTHASILSTALDLKQG